MAESALRAPFAVRLGDGLKQVAVEAIVAAMMRDIVVHRFRRESHYCPNLRRYRCPRSELLERIQMTPAGLEIFDGAEFAEAAAQRVYVADQLGIAVRLGVGHQLSEGSPGKLLLRSALDRLEPRGDARLGRERRQERLREGVNRLDLQPAGAIEHAREELSCPLQEALIRAL